MRKSIFDPVKEQFAVLLEYVNILNTKEDSDLIQEIALLLELIATVKKQCDLYLNYELIQQGNKIRDYYGNQRLSSD